MHISTDRPANIVWSIDSTHHSAVFVTSSTYLNDGRVSKPTRFSWDIGAQTTANIVTLSAGISGFTVPVGGLVALAILCPKTPYALPDGAEAGLTVTDGSHFLTLIGGATHMVTLDNGATAVIVVQQNQTGSPLVPTAVNVRLTNVSANTLTTFAASGQLFDIGEIWFGTLQEFKSTTDPQRTLVDNVTNRRSHDNTNRPLYGPKPYYSWKYTFAPMPNASAYSSASIPTYSLVEYAMSQARSMLILGRIYTPGTTTINTDDLKFFAAFGRPATNGLQQMQAVKDGPFWTAGLMFETQPP